MVNKVALNTITLRYSGLFDFDGMYAAITDWAKNYSFIWHETDYKHKVPSSAGAEQELKWVMEQDVTEYVNYKIVIEVHIWDMLDVEVDVEGKKKSLANARLYLLITPTVTFDYAKLFAGSKFVEKLGKWYYRLLHKDLEGKHIDGLWYRTFNLQALIKKYFDLQSKKYAYKGYLGED